MRPGRTGALALRALPFLLLLDLPSAQAQTTLQWLMPAGSSPASEFRIYKGATPLAEGELVLATSAGPSAEGIYSTQVQIAEIDACTPVYVWLTAANASGESVPSNANFYPQWCDPQLDPDCDPDCDGVPTEGGPAPCTSGQSAGCDDNCPFEPNPGQQDSGGLNSGLPDGIGNACQCGDVSGDGRVNLIDATILARSLLPQPTATVARPELCDVWPGPECNLIDATVLQRALLNPPTATIQQRCAPAQP